MKIRNILLEILQNYRYESNNNLKGNYLAHNIRTLFLDPFKSLIKEYGERYIVQGSPGQGNWADCPWIGIFDSLKTESAQTGYYLVYLFDKNMNNVYLSLNQGVTHIKKEYKRGAKEVLFARAENYRCKLDYLLSDQINIQLNSKLTNPQLYETGNILATCYNINSIPDELTLVKDFRRFLSYYQKLLAFDSSDFNYGNESIEEIKKKRLHEKFDRRGAVSLTVKRMKGYRCEACDISFAEIYGSIGEGYIEVHHLIPFSSLKEGKTHLSLEKDFAVLCSNCHRMIHKLKDSSDLNKLKSIIKHQRDISAKTKL